MFTNHIYLIYRNKPDLTLNNQQWLICHKTKTKQTRSPEMYRSLKVLFLLHRVLWFQVFLSDANNFRIDLFKLYIGP